MATSPSELRNRLQAVLRGQYVLEREVARGGMGVVFQARDQTLDRLVAIKVVQPDLAHHASIAQRFLAEARMIARLRHPNIVAVHSAGEVDGLLYYVMDYVEGETLRQRLTREGRLSPEEARQIAADIAAALDAAAQAGLIHRDVKPANVLLEHGSNRAMLVDFGIARVAGGDGTSEITGDGLVLGTPTYMSPEQAAGEELDQRSDIYALGTLIYEMVAGVPPFVGPQRSVVSQHISARPKALHRLRSECPTSLSAAVMRALDKQPADRWQNGAVFRQALMAPEGPARRRMPWRAVAATALLLAGAAGVSWLRAGGGIPAGVDPRQSILVLPFDNLRGDPEVDWLREGSLSMLTLNLSQWDDLRVVDHGRVHDLLQRSELVVGDPVTLGKAREMAREAGVWTVVLGQYDRTGDTLHLTARVYDVASGDRVDLARVSGASETDVRPLFNQLAASLLNLTGAPAGLRTDIAQATTRSLVAYRAYLNGVDHLNQWALGEAIDDLQRAVDIDSTFGLAFYHLALARGWLLGTNDSVSSAAIAAATRYSASLPLPQRTLIRAYRSFLDHEYAASREQYRDLLARNPTDADAWYGLGEAWFHDFEADLATRWTAALRAFKRTRELDPTYALAFDHVKEMLQEASRRVPAVALMPSDSFVRVDRRNGRFTLDSAAMATAVQRARDESLRLARTWVASQPTTLRAQNALIDAYLASGQYGSALSEADDIQADGTLHPEMPFVRARIFFASGDIGRAGRTLREALDSVTPLDFNALDPSYNLVRAVEASANVFAFQGDLANAARSIQFADQVRTALELRPATHRTDVDQLAWQRWRMSHLFAATGGSLANQRRVWESAAEAARRAPPETRASVANTGAAAALGIFMQTNDTTALTELRALTGEAFSREIRAWLALGAEHLDEAKALMAASSDDTVKTVWDREWNPVYRKPMAAEVFYTLGDYWKAIDLLEDFQPELFMTDMFDVRWGMLGRVRLLRAMAYERLGRRDDAQREYREVLAQWSDADPSMEAFVQEAQRGLARTTGTG